LRIDRLEDRLALAAIPTATVNGPAVAGLIGQDIPLTVTFDNTATNPADIGYSPFVDIVMPATGDAPPTPDDGISFKPGSATYNGLSLATTVLTLAVPVSRGVPAHALPVLPRRKTG
jgi:large repetitive protein